MNILHIYKTAEPATHGGVEKFIDILTHNLSDWGHNSVVLATSKNSQVCIFRRNNVEIVFAPQLAEILSTPISIKFVQIFNNLSQSADIINFNYPWPFMDLPGILLNNSKPYIITYHSDIIKQKQAMRIYEPLRKYFFKNASKIVATSPNYVESSKVLRQYPDKVQIIPIGVDEINYRVSDKNKIDFWQSKLGNNFVLFIGVCRYYKGLEVLVRASAGESFSVVILGDGPELIKIKQLASLMNVSNVIFLGSLPEEDKIAILNLCLAVVLPSNIRSEAYGMSLVEAAACGKPMITCEISTGTSFINSNNNTGYVVPPDDFLALRSAINMIYQFPERTSIMGENARSRQKLHFSAKSMTKNYIDLYESLPSR